MQYPSYPKAPLKNQMDGFGMNFQTRKNGGSEVTLCGLEFQLHPLLTRTVSQGSCLNSPNINYVL